jgi:TPR repeat protein
MTFEIEKELSAAMRVARTAGAKVFARCCELSGVREAPGAEAYALSVDVESQGEAFESMHRLVNDLETPIERARLIRLYLAWKGHVKSQYILGDNFRLGRNIGEDCEMARYWYQKAAEAGDSSAQNNLGVMLASGLGGPKDVEKAVYWYTKGAEGGDGVAKGNLGMHLIEGRGARRNYRAAARLLKEAIKEDPYYSRNHLLLAQCYEHGVGGRSARRLALHHYQEASDFGSLEARKALKRLVGRRAKRSPDAADLV